MIKKLFKILDDSLFRMFVKTLYPKYKRPRKGYMYNYQVLLRYGIIQKIFRVNGNIPWPVDFRSKVLDWKNIEKGIMCDPGDSMGNYINATGGIKFGDNVEMGPNVVIVSVNHDINDQRKYSLNRGIVIGNNVWIGSNCTILAGASIGDNVVIGANCVISGDIPSNSIVKSKSRELEITHKTTDYKWDISKEKLI